MPQRTAIKRYNRTVLSLSTAYAGLLIAAEITIGRHHLAGPLAYVVAILPALPIIGLFAAMGRYLHEERDEYVRMLTVRQSLVATGFALSIATAWSFLESFDLVGHFDAYWIAVIWFGGLGLGSCVNKLAGARDVA